ncbi:hypothetical protein Hypma_004359 [Hypsizygus marmoreus]|uniref:Uncharacterized protein n=1 Tax=Hypsizygus marmoreus TaxID=39966 RepID=A0A369K182_HYPMA|nr:hypothetical protein Hypma_004359 [Hypsizygus marmoreus]
MRNNMQTLSRPPVVATPPQLALPKAIPSIRLISATPSASGNSSTASIITPGNFSMDSSWASIPTPLAPKPDSPAIRKRLVPKKSKLSMLGVGAGREKVKGKDLSDVVRRVGGTSLTASASARGGFEIYVDPTVDDEIGEIVMVKKKKSRVALDGMRWGALGEVTNVPAVTAPKEVPALLKVKGEENKWWSIGRGRKDSKEKAKEQEKPREKSKTRAKSPEPIARDPYPRSKTPEPLKLSQAAEPSRARFNSLDSGILLNTPITMGPGFANAQALPEHAQLQPVEPSPPLTYSRAGTPTAGGLLAPPVLGPNTNTNHQGSIAIRAMRSVRSLARIGSWAQLKNADEGAPNPGSVRVKVPKEKAPKEKEVKEGKKKEKKEKKQKKEGKDGEEVKKKRTKKKEKEKEDMEKDRAQTLRLSTSSFEVGAASPMPKEKTKSLGKKKHSILGLGLPSTMGAMTMRLPTVRNGSTASSVVAPPANNRLSVESAQILGQGRDRAGSVMSTSTASSLRPISMTSSMSGSRVSSGSSVRWDEDCLENVKELRRRERREKEEKAREGGETEKKGKSKDRESRRSSEGRRRTPLSEVFPANRPESPVRRTRTLPIVTVEAATSDGHSAPDDHSIIEEEEEDQVQDEQPLATPVKRARPRPLSEQLLGRSRPRPMYEGEDGVLSILDAATNDLAQLINHLDLEATPATPDMTPLKPSADLFFSLSKGSLGEYEDDSPTKRKTNNHMFVMHPESPAKAKLPAHSPSISSLRPYAQSRKNTIGAGLSAADQMIGQQITPWPTLIQAISPVKRSPKGEAPAATLTPAQTYRLTHKRTLTPAPDPEPAPVFQPLRPARSKHAMATLRASSGSPVFLADAAKIDSTIRGPSSRTFGSISKGSVEEMFGKGSPSQSPVFKRSLGHARQRSSQVPMDVDEGRQSHRGSRSSRGSRGSRSSDNNTVPIPPEARRMLGMSGTMGGSDVSCYAVAELDASDPDSDIPDELQYILHNQSDDGDTMSFRENMEEFLPGSPPDSPLPIPSEPPMLELPSFHAQLIDDENNHADIDTGGNSEEEEDTKKSFDFTGEIQKLNESGASDRRSFVEQLENAFRTPAKIDLRFLAVDVPPVPKLPIQLGGESSQSSSGLDSFSGSELVDMKEPTLLHLNMTAMDDSEETDENKSQFDLFSGSHLVDVKEPTLLPGSDSLGSSNGTQDIVMTDDSLPKSLRASASSGSRPSDGQLNTSFKFGGLPKSPAVSPPKKPQTLSDIIPPPSHVRSLSNSSIMDEDDSVLQSIFAKITDVPQARPRPRVDSDSCTKRRAREIQYRHSRHSSGLSFAGFDSFDEVRRGFEFSTDRPFYPPAPVTRRNNHSRHESLFSIASVSSYGRAVNYGLNDPFDYGLPSLKERPSSEDMTSMSMTVDDTFSFLDRQPRRRVESDASSFYFKAPMPSHSRGHRRHESNMSVVSQGPPVSLYNRSFGAHRRNDSTSSAQSVALSYALHGANGGRAAWARHRQESSMDSVMSDFSMMRLGRPGIGDKMFDTSADRMPLTAISASPPESVAENRFRNRSSFDYDSILDDERRSSMDDSLFDKTGERTSDLSDSSNSVFGGNDARVSQGGLLPPVHYRPVSVMSIHSAHSPMKEDDTMISMLGGGHVRRRSVNSMIDASPCVRIEKRKHAAVQETKGFSTYDGCRESPNKARIVEKPSIASTSSYTFGGERMIKAQRGLLERQSLEESCLIAEGEDLTNSFYNVPVFSRPISGTRSRSSTCTSSSGGETPPLSASDGFSSMDEGSQSSLDLSHLNFALANATHPMSTITRNRVRARAPGRGHRRRASHTRASRSSVYETIEEELSNSPSPNKSTPSMKSSSPTTCQPIFIVDPDTVEASPEQSIWDNENGIIALRKYYALKDEAQTTVVESKRQWVDTPFSVFAVQSFQPPRHPAGMQALLEYSVQNYGPLPSELRPRRVRSRTQSRPSPYPQARIIKASPVSPEQVPTVKISTKRSFGTPVLQQIPINHNILLSAAPSLEALKPFSPLVVDIEPKRENAFGLAPAARPRVGSTARRTALGWSKRSTGKSSTDQKENVSQGAIMTPGESLRINRPRPRGRPTPASTARPIRV